MRHHLPTTAPFSFAQTLGFLRRFPPCQGDYLVADDAVTAAVTIEGRPVAFTIHGGAELGVEIHGDAGNGAGAKQQTSKVVDQFGWDVADIGGVEAARPIEQLCILWCAPGFLRNDWAHAFKWLKLG